MNTHTDTRTHAHRDARKTLFEENSGLSDGEEMQGRAGE